VEFPLKCRFKVSLYLDSVGTVLAKTYVDPLQLVRLAARLGMEAVPLTVEEFTSLTAPQL
jgi:hypothetical protein